MKRFLNLKGLVVLLLVFSLFSCRSPRTEEKAKEETFGASAVKVVKVKRQKISEKLSYTGTLEAWQKINITPDIGGKIAAICVDEGDRVSKGQILAELDTVALRLQLKQAEAGFSVAEASFKDAERNKERMDRLIKENAVSEQQYEKIKLAHEAAQAQLDQAQAALNLVRHNLDVSIMKAPFSGVIASKNSDVGDVINPMMGSFSPVSGVLTLVDFSQVKITVGVSQNDILSVRKGQSASLKVASHADRVFQGTVNLVNLAADSLSKKFNIEAIFDNPDFVLRPGTFGEITLEVSTHEDALVLPQKAIIEGKYVFLAQGNRAEKKEVTLGLQNTDLVEVITGVREGDLVIIEGNFGLENGAEIKIQEEVKK